MGRLPLGVLADITIDVAGESSCDSRDDVGDIRLEDACDDMLCPASALLECMPFGAGGGGTEGGGVGGGSLIVGSPVPR